MDYAKLLERCRQVDERHPGSARSFVDNANRLIKSGKIDYTSVDDATSFLYINGSCGRTSFSLRKKYLQVLYDVLVEHKIITQGMSDMVLSRVSGKENLFDNQVSCFMFKDLDQVLRVISDIGASAINDKDMFFEKSLAILLWYEVDVGDIIQIRKSDLSTEQSGVWVGEKFIALHDRHFDILLKYASIATYRAYPSGKCYELTKSPWLFRSWKKQQLDTNNIRTRLKDFNQSAYVIASGKAFGVDELKMNGRFYRIFMKQAAFSDKHERNNKKDLYKAWIDYYWSEQ